MRTVLAVFLVLIFGISTFPQTVIKEKVEITPKSNSSHTLLQQTLFNPNLCNDPQEYNVWESQDNVACVFYGNGELSAKPIRLSQWPVYTFIAWGGNIHVKVLQGAEYVQIKIDSELLRYDFVDAGDDF